jgi:uncharacterized protein (DUF2249 family)
MNERAGINSRREKTVTVDVRNDIRNGREPFSRIMNATGTLQADEQLLLLAPFEPVPLVGALEKQGFRHTSRQMESGEWEVLFTREAGGEPARAATAVASDRPCGCAKANVTTFLEVDARGLEPPGPMNKILEAVAALPAGADLRARTDRRPLHLYSQLEERGFTAQTEQQTDDSFITHIRSR